MKAPKNQRIPYAIHSIRSDRWADLARRSEAWSRAAQKDRGKLEAELEELIRELTVVEHYFAYPGLALMEALQAKLAARDSVVARLARRIAGAISAGTYRHDVDAWRPDAEEELNAADYLPAPMAGGTDSERQYFEVLSLTPADPGLWSSLKNDARKLRRPEDPFVFELVTAATYVDALVAVLFNYDLQAVIVRDRFDIESRFPDSKIVQLVHSILKIDVTQVMAGNAAIALAKTIRNIRPELDLYLLTDQGPEDFAGSPDAGLFRRVFYGTEELLELHLAVLDGVGRRFETPYFDNLKRYANRPIGTFHALPVARGKSVFRSHWIQDMGRFYGTNLFLAESSATTGGLDSLLEPTGNIKRAQDMAARAFGAHHAFWATNGTSTSNKIMLQALLAPGDIALIDRNCHKSHHYASVLSGAQPLYLEAYPMKEYSMYGAVPLASIKKALLDLKAEGKLDLAKLVDLTNCTFDGHMYNTAHVMEECLAIKPDLIFLWDEAWFGFARFSMLHRRRTAMGAAQYLERRYRDPKYREEYAAFAKESADASPDKLLSMRLKPDPDKVRIRVYQTHSTHKSMSALRQGSMMLVRDQDFHLVEGAFHEAFFTHTSTSPNLQILASLDLARRQMELEGYELTSRATEIAFEIRRLVNDHPLVSKHFSILTPAQMIPAELRQSGIEDFGRQGWSVLLDAMDDDEVALDPTRLTLFCGAAGFDGTEFKGILAERFDIQLNKTSRNSVLLQVNINNTRSDAAHLIKVLAELSRDIEERLARASPAEIERHRERVRSLAEDVPDLPNFTRFHDAFRDDPKSRTSEGHMREAFYMSYKGENCEFVKLNSKEMDERLANGPELVAADFVIPYPPGFPIMVPGQVINHDTIEFMRKLDVKEIHGYNAAMGLRVLATSALSRTSGNARR